MGKKCCASGCRSYYDKGKDYANVFKFPSYPERKDFWVRKLHFSDFSTSGSSVVCIKHFHNRFITREDGIKGSNGTEFVISREKKKKLSREMVVRLFIKYFVTSK